MDPKTALEQQLKALELAYIASFPEKKRAVIQAWQRLRMSGYDQTAAKELFKLTHKLSGSGGLYGFSSISDVARKIEYLLADVLADEQVSPDADLQLESLFQRLVEVLDEFSAE